MKRQIFAIATVAVIILSSCGQNNNCNNANSEKSTIVNSDGTVTFRYHNPNAKEVLVDVQFAGRNPMTKDSVSGIWTATLGPAEPDLYPYCFVVDNVSIMDPKCNEWFPNEGFKSSILDIPGTGNPLIHSHQQVPHSKVEYINYYSTTIQAYNNAIVVLPPSYDKTKKYPVFYLISGTTDTEEVYLKVGHVNDILDNLLAQNLCREMIIILPYGNPTKLTGSNDMLGDNDIFSQDLNNDLMPYIESHYSTINDSDHRAIGGFSRGGNQGLFNGLSHLDKFSYLCSYSSFTSTEIPNVYDNAQETNSKIKLFWLGVGTDDFLYGNARDYTEFLDNKGIRCVKEYTDNKFGHTWMNARYFLDKTMRLLFDPEASQQAMANTQPTKAKTGQEKQFTPGVMARLFPKSIVSPEFDTTKNTVTFRFQAPNSKRVQLEGDFINEPIDMVADTNGVFEATIPDIVPDVYCYNFIVDGLKVCDPRNMYLAADNGFKRSVLNMPNEPFAINRMKIDYQPVRYEDDLYKNIVVGHKTSRPPIILHTADKNESYDNFIKVGHVNQIYEQLLAEGKCDSTLFRIEDMACCPGDLDVITKSENMTWAQFRKIFVEELTKRKQ